ncbi:sensor histidine kinase [Paenibacillus qinlingensis]|uniref:sensor histidine kinase n=1 Tax=Paenibacillus qinlingensis TaxID=1837343 RepID=UPI001566C6A5|nr:histidine kinase [Paenibacillus qinlingensis]
MNIVKDFLLQFAFIATLVFTFQTFFAAKSERNRQHIKVIQAVLLAVAIVLCMSFPAYITDNIRLDIRIVPLLLGTLYAGWRTGVFLSVTIILYRLYLGTDLGLFTTILTLVVSMPVILFSQKSFLLGKKKRRIQLALLLSITYCLVGLALGSIIRGVSIKILLINLIYVCIATLAVWIFTSLNETIKEILSKNQQLQTAAKDAEISFLRSQINPHFLYNSLNSIAALCTDEPQKAESLTLDLAQYLKNSFNFKHMDTFTTIESELELIKAYLNIEKARFGTRLDVEYDVDAQVDVCIPPLSLQPLVENAIKHGLMTTLQGGTVKISIKKEADDVVRFAVTDNGSGMSTSTQEQIWHVEVDKQGAGIGLRNLSQRLELLYGQRIRIESTEGIGTKVFFDIPVQPLKPIGG